MDDVLWWSLNLATLGFSQLVRPLLNRLGLRELLGLDPQGWEKQGLPSNVAARLVDTLKRLDMRRQVRVAERIGAVLVGFDNPLFPAALRDIGHPPLALAVRGRAEWLAETRWIGIVGARQASEYGREVAWHFGHRLAAAGVGIVSGLARGIDARAHQGALDAGGRTVAFLGCGLDVNYPAELEALRHAMACRGALVTQYPFESRPMGHNFPYRNRLISGLSNGIVVVEGQMTSGSLHTVDWALQQGREVYAVPGSIFNKNSTLPHHLLTMGAPPITAPEDLVGSAPVPGRTVPTPPLTAAEQHVLQQIGQAPTCADSLELGALPASQVLSALVSLEMRGLVRRSPSNRYYRAGPSLN
ncbi:MAG TPA: DNA-processing protein DprA [Candidatus Xenobia bacterium]|jgi:DNA processing protein